MAEEKTTQKKKRIGIVTMYYNSTNYGGLLQAYSLTMYLNNHGYDAKQIVYDFYADGNWEHMVEPGVVYISQPTELGTLYSLKELTDISKICRKRKILFV